MSSIDDFADKLIAANFATTNTLVGCSEKEVNSIEEKFDVVLPRVYKDFLRKMGKQCGDLLQECAPTYPGVLECREVAEALMDGVGHKLKNDDFVFVERYGCQVFWFNVAQGDDPPVYRFVEGDDKPIEIAETFSGSLEMALQDDLDERQGVSEEGRSYRFAV